jgi:two-component system chemotaxis sensor kinase CheA
MSSDYILIKKFIENLEIELPNLLQNLSQYDITEDKDELINKSYRFVHKSLGHSKLFKLEKIHHLFAILEFIFDSARKLNTIHIHSFDYLSKLILENLIEIILDLKSKNYSDKNISLLIEESFVYLHKPIESYIEKKEQLLKSSTSILDIEKSLEKKILDEQKIEIQTNKNEKEQPLFNFSIEALDDEPEELNIPVDKITLISDFYEESYENLAKIENKLVELEENPSDIEILNELFRSLHTIKGGTRILKVTKMEKLSHALEDLLDKLRKGKLSVNEIIIDVLLYGKKLLLEILDEVASKGPIRTKISSLLQKIKEFDSEKKVNETIEDKLKKFDTIQNLKKEINEFTKEEVGSGIKTPNSIARLKERQVESIRVSIEKLDEVINTSSELSITRLQFQEQISVLTRNIRDIKRALAHAKEFEPDRFLSRLQRANEIIIHDLSAYLESNKLPFVRVELEEIIKPFYNELKSEFAREELTLSEELTLQLISFQELKNLMMKNVENLEGFTSRLQNGVMNFRMVPISTLLERFPGLVRDTARQANKKIKLELYGQETELDRVMINSLADPLIHIIRNSIDHGIESEEERISSGKNEYGIIKVSAYYMGSFAIIEISDDGKGIDKEKVLKKAIEKGLTTLDKTSQLNEKEILDFIFAPGFSTASQVTELSGRGVGMDVVFSTISQMQGTIDIKSNLGVGTTIYLKIPLTLAVVRVLIFESYEQSLALPMGNVEEILNIPREDLEVVGNKILYHLRNEVINLTFISKILENGGTEFLHSEIPVIILSDGDSRIGLIVDRILGRQEIVIKNLGSLLKKVPYIMGCTILSDRRLVLVLNPKEILEDSKASDNNQILKVDLESNKEEINILVVDDSQLQRRAIKSTLSKLGYSVDEAENGFDALKLVRIKKYSLLCVDLVMPLMDGFDLVTRLRSIPLYRTIPIIVITSKHSREDKERGIKVGANEFLEKPVDNEILIKLVKQYTAGEN